MPKCRMSTRDHLSLLQYTSMKRLGGWLCRLKKRDNLIGEFYLGQNEDYSLGDSTSDSSEKLLQRGSGGRSIYDLVKGEFSATRHLLYKRFFARPRADVIMKGFSAFLDMRRCKDWDHEISS